MQFDSAIGKAAWRPNQPGSYDVRIAATDGRIASEQSFRIHVLSSLERISFSANPLHAPTSADRIAICRSL